MCFSRLSDDTLGTSIYLVYISIGFQTSRLAIRHFRGAILGLLRPSGPCCLGVAEAPFLSLESSKTATFLVGSESMSLRGSFPSSPAFILYIVHSHSFPGSAAGAAALRYIKVYLDMLHIVSDIFHI